jgi:hypothetical protein
MASRARDLLPRVLEKLNLMQRFLLSAGQFDKRIDEKMPEIVEETLETLERVLRDPAQQRAMRDKILLAVRDWRDSSESRREASGLVAELADAFLKRLSEPAAREGAYRSFEEFVGGAGQTLGAVLRQRFGLNDSDLADQLANEVLGWLSREDTAASVSSWIAAKAKDFAGENGSSHLGGAIGIDAASKERIDASLIEASSRVVGHLGVPAPARRGLLRLAGALGSITGLLIGLLEDALRLLGIA